MVFDNTQEMDDNMESMSEIVANMTTGELTYAVRDTEMNGVQIKKGDFIGITKGNIVVSIPNRLDAIKGLLDKIVKDTSEIVTVLRCRC